MDLGAFVQAGGLDKSIEYEARKAGEGACRYTSAEAGEGACPYTSVYAVLRWSVEIAFAAWLMRSMTSLGCETKAA